MRKFVLFFTVAAVCLGFGACSDEPEDFVVAGTEKEFLDAWQAGQRLFVFDPWKEAPVIHFDKAYEPLFEMAEQRFNWKSQSGKLQNSFRLEIHDTVPRHPFLTKIPVLNKNHSVPDTLYMVCRVAESTHTTLPSYQDMIGRTVNAGGSVFDTPKNQILSAQRLFAAGQMYEQFPNFSFGHGKTKMHYEEMQKSMWEELGVSLSFSKAVKDTKCLFSGSFTQSYETNSIRSAKYEFHYDTHVKGIASLQMSSYLSTPSDSAVFLPYLTDEAILLLNSPGDVSTYQKYPNTKEGIFRLYDDYGTHVLVGGLFGGRYTYLYGRKENYYMESVANSASAELSAKASAEAVEGENWLQTYYRVMGTHKGTLSGAGGDYNSEASEHMDEQSSFIVSGGNASYNISKWDESVTEKNENLALVSYCKRDAWGSIDVKASSDVYVLPLYAFSYVGARRDAMEKYLGEYIESKYTPLKEKPQLVVADFMMKNGDNGNEEKARSKVMKDAFGIERLYFPLVGNKFVPGDAPEGAMLETSSDEYLVVSDGTDQIWWVALAYEDECTPLSHIAFLTSGENGDLSNKYTLRGNRADHDMNYPEIDDHYVGLRFIDPDDKVTKPITGVALTRKGDKGEFYVIASSPGTDMLKPYNTADQSQFKRYWGQENSYKATKAPYEIGVLNTTLEDLDDGSKSDAWFGVTGAANSGNLILPAFTRLPLADSLVYQKPRQFWNKEEEPENDINN